ncbi:MAG: hypothetical protein F6K18_23480 [Okeania sp. SIO2C2]|uniref:hypothetical protein n=1 Tax=Okeania sp. SIO2C2 TaxID=2607787 RepID=UPI0013BA3C60|nr:hypothetical protein [Okeania sp. SIO2C2]NEP89552.1 hypothetical protein [Okeania sp. SIO2C2]
MYFRDWWRNLERSLNSDIKILMGNRWGNGELGVLKYFQLLPNWTLGKKCGKIV